MKPPFLTNKTKTEGYAKDAAKVSAHSSNRPRRSTTPRRSIQANTEETPPSPGFFSKLIQYTSIVLITLFAIGTLLYIKRDQWGITSLINSTSPAIHKPDPELYTTLTTTLEANRQSLKQQYLTATTDDEKQQIINQSCALLEDNLPKMMHCWLGHPWDFNGTATVPGEGKIACGYFVSVIMRDAGFKINRIRVAQQPSQNIIRTFVNTSQFYEVKTNTPYNQYVNDISNKSEGIHIVGLDKHVAFIVIKDGKLRFIHSGGLQRRVVDEAPAEAYALEHSNYRVISNISRNPNVIKKWLLGETFPTGGTTAASR